MATSPELLLISAVVRTGEHRALTANGITEDMFHRYPDEGQWLCRYVTEHRKAPSRQAMRHQFPELRLKKVDDIDYAVAEVRKGHARHAVMTTMDRVADALDMEDMSLALAVMKQGITEAQDRAAGVADSYDAFADWESTYREVSSRVGRVKKNGLAGIPSGFQTLDNITGGFQPGWFSVVAARLGTGKTFTGVRMAFAAAMTGHRVMYYTLEQNRHQVAMRMHSFAARKHGQYLFNSLDLSRGQGFNLMDYKRFLREFQEMMREQGGQFLINDTSRGRLSTAAIASGVERTMPDIVFIDYITLLKTTSKEWQATAELSGELQGICQEYQVPIVGMAQVNRLGSGKEPPNAEHLSQADAIGHDADVLVTMAKPSASVMKMKLAKFRHGPDGIIWWTRFQPGTGRYNEISYEKAQELIEKDREVE